MAKTTKSSVELASPKREREGGPRVIALAQQLGTALGRAQNKADKLVKQVNESTAAVKKSAAKAGAAVKPLAAKAVAAVKTAAAKRSQPASTKRKAKAGAKSRSGGVVDAPGKKHRKPPPQVKINRRSSEPGSPMGQQGMKGRMQRGRG